MLVFYKCYLYFLKKTMQNRYCTSYFTGEETEVQRSRGLCVKTHSVLVTGWWWQLSLFDFQASDSLLCSIAQGCGSHELIMIRPGALKYKLGEQYWFSATRKKSLNRPGFLEMMMMMYAVRLHAEGWKHVDDYISLGSNHYLLWVSTAHHSHCH